MKKEHIRAGIGILAAVGTVGLGIERCSNWQTDRQNQKIEATATSKVNASLSNYLQSELANAGGNYGVVKRWFDSYSFGEDMPNYATNTPTEIYLDSNIRGFVSSQSGSKVFVRIHPDTAKTLESQLIKQHANSHVDTGSSFP